MVDLAKIRVDVPEGKSGNWAVEKFTVSKKDVDFYNLRATFSFGGGGRIIEPGEYTKLVRNGLIIMSDRWQLSRMLDDT